MSARLAIAVLALAACTVPPPAPPPARELQPADEAKLLRGVAELPISSWAYKYKPQQRHVGPMAQDFHAAFGLGDSDKSYDPRDADAIALASLKALSKLADDQDRRIATLEAENAALRAKLACAQ